MTTIKKRLNITLGAELEKAITDVAKRDKVPTATKAAELLEIALLIEEDTAWDILAKNREKEGGKFIDHDNAWN
jgi:hypothetical protein